MRKLNSQPFLLSGLAGLEQLLLSEMQVDIKTLHNNTTV